MVPCDIYRDSCNGGDTMSMGTVQRECAREKKTKDDVSSVQGMR